MIGHTPGPWSIVIDGTCSAAWPYIVPVFFDGVFDPDDAVAELPSCYVERTKRNGRRIDGMPASYLEAPKRFKKKPCHDEVMANAHLIAAAPDLLAAAKKVLEWSHGMEEAPVDCRPFFFDPLRAAVAKAEGES